FVASAARGQLRAHDLRATFVTLNLAGGKSEAWIADRTGHRSSQMINRYRRAARTAADLQLGTLAPLVDAVPDLRSARSIGRDLAESGGARSTNGGASSSIAAITLE